jgi:polygalacturonase
MPRMHSFVRRRDFLKSTTRSLIGFPFLTAVGLASENADFGSRQQATSQRIPDAASQRTKQKLRLNIRDYGATGDGITKDTAAIQETIDRCAVFGGGEVLVPAGRYLTGSVALRANILLRLDKEAEILGSGDFSDYTITQVRWEGKWIQGYSGLISAIDADHIAVVGEGRITGNPGLGGRPNAKMPLRHPSLIEFIRCNDIHLEGFSTTYDHMWSIHPTDCNEVVIRNLTIRSTGGNGDGIDIDSCKHVLIDGCDISTGDDCISLKSGRGSEGYALLRTTENVRIMNCTFADSLFACIGIGSETSGGIRDVHIDHCKFTHAKSFAIYIKSRPGRGAFIEDIFAKDLDVSGTIGGFLRLNILNSGIHDQFPVPGVEGIPTTRNFRFSNIRVKDCPVLVDGSSIRPEKPLIGFSLVNVTGTCNKGISLANIREAVLKDIDVNGYTGPLLSIRNVTGSGLQHAAQLEEVRPDEPLPSLEEPYRLH